MICIFMILGKGLVSRDAASCTPGLKCFFVHYLHRFSNETAAVLDSANPGNILCPTDKRLPKDR